MTVTATQIAILIAMIVLYFVGGLASVAQLTGRKVPAGLRWACLLGGIVFGLILLVWHSTVTGNWRPLQDNLSALLTLALILSGFTAYVQFKRPVPSLDWLVMPVVIVLLLLAGHFGASQPVPYLSNTYSWVHSATTYLGTVVFFIAGATGVLYLMSDRNLRRKKADGIHPPPRPGVFGSLERLEHLTYGAVTLGFALFTVGCITGIVWALHGKSRMGDNWYFSPKVLLSVAAWLVFAVVLNTPIAPRLRGRKMAILSIAGVVLTLATLVAALSMAGGQ